MGSNPTPSASFRHNKAPQISVCRALILPLFTRCHPGVRQKGLSFGPFAVATAMANSSCMLGRAWEYRAKVMVTLAWAVGLSFTKLELSMELGNKIEGISQVDA